MTKQTAMEIELDNVPDFNDDAFEEGDVDWDEVQDICD